jgi:CubicO group peptidase (beta-lactamase class C family)
MTATQTDVTAKLAGFEEFVQRTMQEWKVQGLAVAIVYDGKVILSRGFGLRDAAHDLPVTEQTLFPIASCTKAFTTTAMGILADQGKLDWNTPVRTYLPDFKLHDAFASERMTPRDLVTHCSGLPRHDLMWYNSSASREELVERLRYLEPTKDFRSLFQYQNLMFMMAGYLVGQIAGQSWEAVVQQAIFDRLDMVGSNFDIIETTRTATDFSHPYKEENDEVKEIPFYAAQGAIAPAGAIVSNVDGLSRWVQMHMNKGKYHDTQIVSESQIALLHSPQMIIPERSQYTETPYASYAFGWAVEPYRGHPMLQHGGNIDGFSSFTSLFPDDKFGMVVLSNMSGTPVPVTLTYYVADHLFGMDEVPWNERFMKQQNELKEAQKKGKEKSEVDRVPDTHPSHALDAYVGDYAHSGYGVLSVRLSEDGNSLQATFNNMTFPLEHYHYDIFDINIERFEVDLKASFTTDVRGGIVAITVPFEPTGNDIIFKRLPDQTLTERSFLEQFIGAYEILGMVMTIALKGEHTLFASLPGEPDYELVPRNRTDQGAEFQAKGISGVSVEFKIDASGNVTEALITQPYGTFTAKRKA